jgi:vancomycin resistance protein YoaR
MCIEKTNSMRKIVFVLLLCLNMCVFGFCLLATPQNLAFGVDISGLNTKKATQKATQEINTIWPHLRITLTFEDKNFVITSKDLAMANVENVVSNALQNARGSFFEQINIFKNRSKKIIVPTAEFLLGLEEKIAQIKQQVERPMQEPQVSFYPNKKNMFVANDGVVGVELVEDELKQRIVQALEQGPRAEITLPVILTPPTKTKSQVLDQIKMRSEFSTNYSSSVGGRRFNVQLALSAFNGMVVKPGEVVSFNKTIDSKIPFSKFQVAKIIVNGQFVDGRGGGICQASTTLYNAVLLAGLDVIKVHPHSLPVGYVKLGFDAMVNQGNADLVFQNTTEQPIYIRTHGNDDDCFVEIYGEPLPKGLVIKRKSVFVRSIKHNGDKIIPDTQGLYADKILFKGEFHRVKYPVEGVESKSYLQYYVDGELVEERLIRQNHYNPQQGIVYEGVEPLPDDLTAPIVQTFFTPPQEQTQTTQDNVEEQIKKVNPSHFSP